MRRPYFIFSRFTFIVLTLPLLTTLPAFAQEAMGASATEGQKQEAMREAEGHKKPAASAAPAARTAPAKSDNTNPQIIIDEKTNTVRVLIGGKEVLTIDAKGLHVHGNLDYSGIITVTGKAPP